MPKKKHPHRPQRKQQSSSQSTPSIPVQKLSEKRSLPSIPPNAHTSPTTSSSMPPPSLQKLLTSIRVKEQSYAPKGGQAKAIETVHNGYRFRSRLEARWAVFFDTLHLPYNYEPEGYDLDGLWYLPDFWLPTLDCWIEIKRTKPTAEEKEKAKRLAWYTQKDVYICKVYQKTALPYRGRAKA